MNISPGHTGHPNLPEGSSRPSWGQTLGVLAFVLVVGAVGYAFTGRPDALKDVPVTEQAGHDGVSQEQIAAMVEGLATRLKQQPDDAKGWAMLGRSYMFMGRHEDAKKALQELVRLQPNDPNALADLADAAAMVQGRTLQGEPMQWVQRALKIDPQHVKALALAGTEAFARQDYVQAARYWETITKVEPPDSPVHQQAQAGVEEARKLAGAAGTAGASGTAMPALEAKAKPQTKTLPSAPASTSATVSGTVTLSASLRSKVSAEDTVFIFARPAEGSRMPLAILRKQVKDLPIQFKLDDSMGMGQGPNQGLAHAQQVVVGARVSKSGQAMPQAGDLEGFSAPVPVGQSGIQIEISTVK